MQKRGSPSASVSLVLILLFVIAACRNAGESGVAAQGLASSQREGVASQEPVPPQERGGTEEPDAEEVQERAGRISRNIWWNNPKLAEALALGPEERKQMDALLQDYLQGVAELRRRRAQEQRSVESAVLEGRFVEAREAAARLAQLSADLSRQEWEMRIGVLATLKPEQWQKLKQEYPSLLRSPWLRGGGMAAGQIRQGRSGQRPRRQQQ